MTKEKQEYTFVLGAQDPEMREIERVLKQNNIRFVHASKDVGRCRSNTAYDANQIVLEEMGGYCRTQVLHPKSPVVFVECSVANIEHSVRIDHHNPGDPGYEIPAERYLEGSSLAQTLTWLNLEPTSDQKLLAAADHCLTAAYQGLCPGVDPGDLLFMRTAWKAKISERALSEVIDNVMNAAKACRSRFNPETGEAFFNDPTRMPPDLPEGSAYAGIPVRYRGLGMDGTLKEMLKGASPEHILRFMKEHEDQGREVYGNPYRGYAGTYFK